MPPNSRTSSNSRALVHLCCWLAVASLTAFVCEAASEDEDLVRDEGLMSVTDEEEPSSVLEEDIFVPTKEWKVVKDGQHIPPGLHVRMNFQTGVKEAKLLEEEEEEEEGREKSSVHETTRPYGHMESDRRGVVNKRTKVFSVEEVADMLKDLNNDTVDLAHLPQLASGENGLQPAGKDGEGAEEEMTKQSHSSSSSSSSSRELPVTLHRDVEAMLELSTVLANSSSTVSGLCQALEELEFYVHQIQNARDLNSIGGLVLVVRLLNHTHPDVKSWAARVIGSASQSNPPVQELALEYGSLPILCRLLSLSEEELVQRRALFALSALLRGNPREQIGFIEDHRGLSILGESFAQRSLQVQLKSVVLLTDLLNDEFTSSSDPDVEHHHVQLPLLIHSEVLHSGWCEKVPLLLLHSDQLPVVEKGLLAMTALQGTCSFSAESARLQVLVEQLERGLVEEEMEVDSDYTNNLLEHCRALLRYILRKHSEL